MTAAESAITVVVPAYNVEPFIAAAINRLLEQTVPPQIVVVDDASTDDTGRIVQEFAASDPRVTLVSLRINSGVAAARQAGVEASRGRFIWFVDADDEWPADAVETLLAAADATNADIVCARADYVFSDGSRKPVPTLRPDARVGGADAFRAMLVGRLSGHLWNKLFAARLFEHIDFTRSPVHSDQAMVAQLLVAAGAVVGTDSLVYRYRLREGSIIRSDRRRADSLDIVAAVLRQCARRLGSNGPTAHEFAYYTARFSLLSRMKDATSGAYSIDERRALVRRARKEMSRDVFAALARERDAQRLALLIAARTNLTLYRILMNAGGGRR